MPDSDEQSFDSLAERGQYRAFQRAYGKENQAMLGLILLTVAWSYAAHVYGHASVFTWFVRYLLAGLGLFGLYHLLLYAHAIFERAVDHYRNWEREQNDALRDSRNREKARERRKKTKNGLEDPPSNREPLPVEENSTVRRRASVSNDEEQKLSAAKLKEEAEAAKARKRAAENEQDEARKEVERRNKVKEAANAASRKAQKEAKQKQKAKQAAEVALSNQRTAPAEADISADNGSPVPDEVAESHLAAANAPPSPPIGDGEGFKEITVAPAAQTDTVSPVTAEPRKKRDSVELTRAETAVAVAKQEAERAQRQLAMAEELANRARAQTKNAPKVPAPVAAPVAGGKATAAKGQHERRSQHEKRDSFKMLRPAQTGSGYVPPHLRDGYTPKPSKQTLPPDYNAPRERSTSNATRKKSFNGTRNNLARPAGSPASPNDDSPGSNKLPNGGGSPGSDSAMSSESGHNPGHQSRRDSQPGRDPAFESRSFNVFAMLSDGDEDRD